MDKLLQMLCNCLGKLVIHVKTSEFDGRKSTMISFLQVGDDGVLRKVGDK